MTTLAFDGRDLLHELEHLLHRGPGADHVGAGRERREAPPQQLHLAHRLLLLERALEHEPQPRHLERLLDEVVGALLDGLDGRLDGAAPGEEHDRALRQLGAQRAQQPEPVHVGHHEVGEDHVGVPSIARRSASVPSLAVWTS